MSSIHKMSSEVPLPKFDLFGVPPTQTIIEKDIVTEHRPITTIDTSSFVQFEVLTAVDEYIDLEKLFLYMKVRVKNDPKVKKVDFADIGPVNYFLHSVIKQLDVFIGDKQITTSSPTYAYKAYVEAMLGYAHSAKMSFLKCAGWYADEFEKKSETEARAVEWTDYQDYDYYGRLHTDLSFQGRSLLGGCKLIIRILFNDPKFYLMSSKFTPELDFKDISLFIHRSKVSRMLVEGHAAALKLSTAKYPITLSNVKAFTINQGVLDANIDNIHSGQLPRRIFIFAVDNIGYNGDYKKNPFWFIHAYISTLTVHVGGDQFPVKPFSPDFTISNYAREYMSLFEALDMIDGESTIDLQRNAYDTGNTIFGFNFAPDLSIGSGATGYLNPIRIGSLRLNVRFSKPLAKTITLLVYCEFDKLLEIDINRNAFIDLF